MSSIAPHTVAVSLVPAMFSDAERVLLETTRVTVTGFTYRSGVAALRVRTPRLEVVLLPFRGQQVWRYGVHGEELTMTTHFDEPTASTSFGETYGAFMLHCGLSGIGAPGPEDSHPHHGELPNAHYEAARLMVTADTERDTVTLTGDLQLRTSHVKALTFSPSVTISSDATALDISASISNQRSEAFQYSYLCHVNWALMDGAMLEQTLRMDAPTFRVDPHPSENEPTSRYTSAIAAAPALSNRLSLDQPLAPEYCAVLTPHADDQGWAHFLMVRPDARAAAVSYEVAHLPHAIRWISNTGDERAAGFCLPSTGHHHGRNAAQADGMLVSLEPGETHTSRVVVDFLDADVAAQRRSEISSINAAVEA